MKVSPDKGGRIHQTELHSFMGRENRSYGELLALLERELLKTIVDACRESRDEEEKTGQEDPELLEKYRKIAANIRKEVENVYNKPAPVSVPHITILFITCCYIGVGVDAAIDSCSE